MMLLAFLAGGLGAVLVYLGGAQQNWLARRPVVPLRLPGALLCLLSLLAWCHAAGVAAGTGAALTTLMLAWVAAPYAGWWLRRRGDGR